MSSLPSPSVSPGEADAAPARLASAVTSSNTLADGHQWFRDEVHPHGGQLKSWLRGNFPAVRDVDDVVQESYLRVWKARLARPITRTKSFLFQVARHIALDLLRRGKRANTDYLGDLSDLGVTTGELSPLDALSHREKISLTVSALLALPDRCRQVFILRKFEGVSQKDIAARLGISERTVESQVTRGMKLFEAELRRQGLDGFVRDEK